MRIFYGVLFALLAAALFVCSRLAKRSQRSIATSVSVLLGALIPPVLGNMIIVVSSNESLSILGYYTYFLGMVFVIFSLLNFALDYCSIAPLNRLPINLAIVLLVINAIQLLLNIFIKHAFTVEATMVSGAVYYKLIPLAGLNFHRALCYVIFASVLIIFIVKIIKSPKVNKEKYAVILLAMIFTALWQSYYVFSNTPSERSMIGYAVFGLLVYFLSMRYRPVRLLDGMLAAIASEMPEALYFFDNSGSCIWANATAKKLVEHDGEEFEGVSAKLDNLFDIAEKKGDEWKMEKSIGNEKSRQSYVIEKHSVKDKKGRLAGSFISVRDNTVEQQTLKREIYNATHDALTGVYNRSGYNLLLSGLEKDSTSMVLIDVDHFKLVNDNYGHETGDRVLKRVADTISHTFRSDDFVCRMGGDEFAILLVNAGGDISSRVTSAVNGINSVLLSGSDGIPAVSVSAGVAKGSGAGDFRELFEHADSALYQTKRGGMNGLTFFS